MDQARYSTSTVTKYLDTTTMKENPKFHKTNLTYDIIFAKEDYSTSYEQMEVLSRE